MATILQINSRVNMGSVSRITEQVGQTILQNGWDSYIAYGRDPRPSQSKLIRIGTDLDIGIHKIYSLLLDKQGLASSNSTKRLIKKIIEIRPDLIHLQNIHGYYLNYKLLFNFFASYNIPIVWTFHDCWSITGHCSHFDLIKCNKWKTRCYDCPQYQCYPKSLFLDNSEDNYALKKKLFTSVKNMTLVPVSDWIKSVLKDSFLSIYPIHRIYNGIDINVFSPKSKSVADETRKIKGFGNKMILLGVATSWGKNKGLYDFYQLQSLINEDTQIVLVGLSDKQLKDLPSNILGIKRTENLDQLASLYSTADLFLNLTYEDTFPTTNIESLSCGTPVLTYKTGGSPESLTETTGFVVEQGDLEGVLMAIRTVKEKGKAFYSTSCRNRVLANFKREDRYQEYFDLYKQLLRM